MLSKNFTEVQPESTEAGVPQGAGGCYVQRNNLTQVRKIVHGVARPWHLDRYQQV